MNAQTRARTALRGFPKLLRHTAGRAIRPAPAEPNAVSVEGLHHAVVLRKTPQPGGQGFRWMLYFNRGCALVPFALLSDFFASVPQGADIAWQRESAQALGLLADFVRSSPNPCRRSDLLEAFSRLLRCGSVGRDAEDPLGLFWLPMPFSQRNRLRECVGDFAQWLKRLPDDELTIARNASPSAAALIDALLSQRRERCIHPHRPLRRSLRSRHLAPPREATPRLQHPINHEQAHILAFLSRGFFPRTGDQLESLADIRDRLIVILMCGAGLRVNEALHLFRHDVVEDPSAPGVALVRLFHPELGSPPGDAPPSINNRAAHLRHSFGLAPRHRIEGNMRAEYTPSLVTHARERYSRIHWFPQVWGRLFWQLYSHYIQAVEAKPPTHPYLFCDHASTNSNEPLTVSAFHASFEDALTRAGVCRCEATKFNPHEYRRAYLNCLIAAGVSPRIVRHAMRFSPIAEQLSVASIPTAAVASALAKAETNFPFDPFALPSLSKLKKEDDDD